MFRKLKKSYFKFRADVALSVVEKLENERAFISTFFCGETAYPIKKKEWESKMKKAKSEFNKYKKYL